MEIISTNIGDVVAINYKGREIRTGIFKYPVNQAIFLSKNGVQNDRVIDLKYHGGEDKSCYLYSASHYAFWNEKYPKLNLTWGMFGENLSISELDEAKLYIGDEFQIGQAIVQISQPRIPCFKLGLRFESQKIVQEFIDANLPGAYVRVLKEGLVKKGDQMALINRYENELSLKETNLLIYSNASNLSDNYNQILNSKFLAASCLKEIKRKWA